LRKRKASKPNYPLKFNNIIVTGDMDTFKRNFEEIIKPPEYLSSSDFILKMGFYFQ